ncbi:SRPBCC family protein [Croceitalea rosinachiae]|uniref:SRPBCC domain-containing protein n=1 Tax=Croceitalea rosinachiae TaxID=3075596 RepID=A0ABU3ABP6_9FLAO|nr:SRPBCC domain-containing protein [Croceitalea sp. F388]MDT0607409.1 SRPBCC domain-containing protein [Croceitalea sp. F388]
MKVSEPPVIVEQLFKTTRENVWNALTQLDEMRQWFFPNIEAFEAKPGFKTDFTVKSEERIFPHLWEVLEVIPHHKMVQEWKYGGYDGLCTITFELYKDAENTLLKVTATVLEDFPDDIPEFKRESCVVGWKYFINESLKDYIENELQ